MSLRRLLLLTIICCFATASASAQQSKNGEWQSLFDGKTLQGWNEAKFTKPGKVSIENGAIIMAYGNPMTGVTRTASFPRSNYEVRFEAMRIKGGDFFASITFPVKDAFCTWVAGGWGGDIVGLSSIDGWDASENETRTYFNFEDGRWYGFRMQVTDDRIKAWIDDTSVIDVVITGRAISLRRGETNLSTPLGFSSYSTTGGLRKIEYRLLKPPVSKP